MRDLGYPEEEKYQSPWWDGEQFVFPARFTPNPSIHLPDNAELATFSEYHAARYMWHREETIARETADPLNYGFEPECWQMADAEWAHTKKMLIMGGNAAGKTYYAAKRIVRLALQHPNARIWCFSQTEDVSNQLQQPFVWNFIPQQIRKARKTKITNVTYSEKGGFTENSLVFPNRTSIRFKFYAQGVQTLEGPGVDIIWFDEEAPLSFIETAAYRLSRATAIWPDGGEMLLTFTPIDGYTATVKSLLTGKKTLREVPAPLLEREKDGQPIREMVPLIEESPTCGRILYFHTSQNPWSNYNRLVKEEFARASREQILCRAYGVPTKPLGVQFPRFRPHIHVRTREEIYELLKAQEYLTWYHSVDPCAGRNWFQGWAAAFPGKLVLVREHPQEDDWIPNVGFPGPWAEPSEKPDGKPGSAQKKWGFGFRENLAEIVRVEEEISERMEQDIKIEDRIIDSRAASGPFHKEYGTTTLLEELNDKIDETYEEFRIFPDFTPAQATRGESGSEMKEGIELLNDALAWNEDKELNPFNEPELLICADCTNTIYALSEFTGLDGLKGACKDPIDMLRYLKTRQAEFIDESSLQPAGGGSY